LISFTYVSGTINAGTSTVVTHPCAYNCGMNRVIDSGSVVLNNITFATGWNIPTTIAGTMKVAGNVDITSGTPLTGGTIEVGPNMTLVDGLGGTTAITLNGTGNQLVKTTAGTWPMGNFIINKPSGTATLVNDLILGGTGQNLNLTSGSLDLSGFALSVGDVFTCEAGTTITQNAGSFTPNAGVKFVNNGCAILP